MLENKRDLPLHPKIRTLFDADGKKLKEPVELWLTEDTGKTIVTLLDDCFETPENAPVQKG